MEAAIQGIQFHTMQGVSKLTIQNPSTHKLGLKIRTNHKTALNIHPTHDFIDPNSKKDIIVKLVEVHPNVKLQVNYAIATEEMLTNNDSKLSNVDKKYIKKEIVTINISDVKANVTPAEQKPKQHPSEQLNTSFSTVAPQKSLQITKSSFEKKTSLGSSINLKQTQQMVVAEQKQQEQSCEREEKVKTLKNSIKEVEDKITQKRKQYMDKKQQLSLRTSDDSFINPIFLPLIIIAAFFLGSLIKVIIF